MHVPVLSIVFIIFDMILGILVPVSLLMFISKKYKADILAFFIGVLTMLLFALVFEQIVHAVVLNSSVGKVVQANAYLMGIYGGLMAALFEETGRFLSMKYVLKKNHKNKYNAIMYGAGHGGFEMMMILVMGMINNLIYALFINLDKIDVLMAPLDATTRTIFQSAVDTLVNTNPFMFIVSPLERIAALGSQLAMSVIMWFAVTKAGKKVYFWIAFAIHFVLDAVTGTLSGLGVNIIVIEVLIWVASLVFVIIAKKIWDRETTADEYLIVTLRERPELKDIAAEWFNSKWDVPKEAYLECMNNYIDNKTNYGWYLCLDGEKIIGGLGVIDNDFHDRKDLAPNVCAVYTEEEYRGNRIAGNLLDYVVEDCRDKGISPVYLVTDHENFYERYGWEFLCMVQGDGEDEMTRMYIHK